MKKIIITLAAVAAAFTMASCNKEQLTESEGTPVVGNDVITAFTESTLTKTSLSGNDTDGYEVFWSEGDTFKMGDNTFTLIDGANTTSGKFQGTLPEGDGPFTAYYPATYNGTDWPTSQTYSEGNITGSPMTAEVVKGAESLSFKNAGGILRLTLKGTAKVGSIKVSATGLDEITLDCGSGVALDNTNGTVFHIAMPEGEYSGVSIAVWTTDYDDCTKKLKEGTQLKIERSKITTAAFTASFPSLTSTDPLPGAFSIADGKQVCFSRGNLRYTVGSKEWSFYDKQYKCGPLHAVDSKEISLFTWGYNATQSINPIGSASNNVSITSGDLSPAQDWGSVFGENSLWRTLTSAEWTYLFEGRTDAADKYGYATVGGQKGLIILPDEFTDPMKNGGSGAFKPQSSTASSWTDNYYTLAGNWEAMEAAGAVFLPAAGRRGGDSIATGSNEQGHYWSSSAVDSDKAYFVYFNYNSFDPAYSWRRDNGCSVRLVTDLYTVTFDMNGKEGTAPESLKGIKYGSKIAKPSDPTVEFYEFTGWYKDNTCAEAWNFDSDVVTSNITLFANWRKFGEGYAEVKAEAGISGNTVKWIQLWENGPKFAEFNVGAKSVSDYGGHYCWGSDINEDKNLSCWQGDNISGHDTATRLWGENWRMPSKDELDALISNCTCTWTNGYYGGKGLLFTGKGDYSSNILFLPAAGIFENTVFNVNVDGRYWSTTPSDSSAMAYDLDFGTLPTATSTAARIRSYSVRAVLIEKQVL